MGTQRASNKDILDAINALTAAITSTKVAPVFGDEAVFAAMERNEKALPVLTEGVTPAPDRNVNAVPKSYLQHMTAKVTSIAHDKGESHVIYLRRNGAGEQKLAYCKASNWTTLKDRGIIGAVAMIEA